MEKYKRSLGFCGLSDLLKVKGSFFNLGQVTRSDFDKVDTSTFLEWLNLPLLPYSKF